LAATEPVEQSGDAGTASTGSRRQPVSARAIASLAVVALLVLGLDQLTKFLVVTTLTAGERNPVVGDLLQFVFVKNSGAAFSLASGSTWIFSIAASAVTIFIIVFSHRIRSMAWAVLFGMLLGGTLGNLIDRLFREPSFGLGHVVDFIQVWGFPAIFNVADIFIVSSMGLFIILSVRGVRLDGTREASADRDAVPEAK
jgi:signal peptidase II